MTARATGGRLVRKEAAFEVDGWMDRWMGQTEGCE